jgi:hypothetical protein
MLNSSQSSPFPIALTFLTHIILAIGGVCSPLVDKVKMQTLLFFFLKITIDGIFQF